MSTLPGNPHLEMAQANLDAEELLPEGVEATGLRELAQIEATLAVAHELRTANLIALGPDSEGAARLILSRLGLNGGESQ